MHSFRKVLFITTCIASATLAHMSSSQAADCSSEVAPAAEHFAQENNNFYGCRAIDTQEKSPTDINVTVVCSADTGSHSVVVNVSYADSDSCANPSLTQLSVD